MPPHDPDLLLVNGNVLTMDPGHARASAVAVTGGRITAVRLLTARGTDGYETVWFYQRLAAACAEESHPGGR